MIKKFTLILAILFLYGLTSEAATYTVTNNLNNGPNSLRDMVQQANTNPGADIIVFQGNYNILLSSEIVISDALTITGTGRNNTIVDGSGTSRIFNITTAAGSVTISDMTIQNGLSASGAGGGIFSNANLSISNVSLLNNASNSSGGALYGNVSLTLNNTTISNNKAGYSTATSSFSGLYSGGGVYANDALTLEGSIVCNNNMASVNGGGIYKGNTGDFTTTGLTDIIFDSNIAINTAYVDNSNTGGGGLYSSKAVSLRNATITNNITGGKGGGVIVDTNTETLTLTNANISKNKAGYDIANNVFFPTGNGGGVYAHGSLVLNGSITFEDNQTSTEGGGLWKSGFGTTTATGLTSLVVNKNFTNNGDGGGMYFLISLNLSAATTVTFTNNIAGTNGIGNGAGLRMGNASTLIMNGGTFSNNTAKSSGGALFTNGIATLSNVMVSDNVAVSSGGGIYAGTLTLNNTTVNNNAAKSHGGGIYSVSNLTLNTATISNNKAGYDITSGKFQGESFNRGGGLYTTGNTPVFKGAIVFQNDTVGGASIDATPGGGAIFTDKPLLIDAAAGLTSLLIDACASINPTNGTSPGINNTVGGGIFVNTGGNLTMKGSPAVDVTVKNCTSVSSGGGIFVRGNGVTLDYVTVTKNRSTNSHGGGIYGDNATGNFLDIKHSTITYNIAKNQGGGISTNTTVPATIANTEISSNSAFSHGGGIYAGNTLTLNIVSLNNNKAGYGYVNVNDAQPSWQTSGNGGGIYAANTLTLQGAISCQNDTTAANGGGIYKNATSTFDVTGLTSFAANYNRARNNDGGGIYTAAALTMSNKNGVILTSNMAGTNGGGIAAIAALRLDSLSILNNTAINQGGGVHSSGAAFTSNANTFAQNNAKDGGGIYSSNILTITNNTFSQNTASNNGGALNLNSTANINVILSSFNGNTATTSGQAIYMNNATSKTFNGNIIYGNGSGNEINLASGISGNYNIIRTTSPFAGTGNLAVSPGKIHEIFKNFLPGDLAALNNNGGSTQTLNILRNGLAYNLVPQNSTWIAGITADQTGTMRVRGCNVDAGSVELQITDPATSQWISGGNADDWNDPANWKNWDSNNNLITEPAIPSICTNVVIPEGTTTYPVLQKAGTILLNGESYAQAACDTITFKFGGEVAKTNYLNYKSAAVQLKLKSNTWEMLSPPLRNMYSGDYFVDRGTTPPAMATETRNGVPAIVEPLDAIFRLAPGAVSMKLYQTDNPQTGTGKGASKFSGTFKNVDTPLLSATGYVVWVNDDVNQYNTFSFPKKYNYYNYYYEDGITKSRENATSMDRSYLDRFVYESNVVGANGSFTQSIDNSTHSGNVIVGNPYMSHLDLGAFQSESTNANYFQPQFAIWNGYNYDYLLTGKTPISTSGMTTQTSGLLAPMEPVLMYVNSSHVNDNTIPVTFTPNMSVTSPGSTLLRSSSEEPSNILKLEIVKGGIRQSGLALCYKEGVTNNYDSKKDVWTIIPNSVTSYISLYMLVDRSAASIHTTGDITSPIDLGIAVGSSIKENITSGKKETYTIQISGDNKYLNNKTIYLYDALKKEKYNLSQSPYAFENTTGDVIQRFQLFAAEGVTAINDISSGNNILISSLGSTIIVGSALEDPITTVDVYNIMGRLLYQKTNLNVSDWTFTLPEKSSTVIVKVQTQKNGKVQKLMTKVNQ